MKFTSIRWLIFVLCPLFLFACSTSEVEGTGPIVSEVRPLAAFSKIKVQGDYHVVVHVGKTQSIVLDTNKELLPYIKTKVDNDTLEIYNSKNVSLHPNGQQIISIVVPTISTVTLYGANHLQVIGIKGDHFVLKQNGSNESNLTGTVKMLTIEASGQTTVNAQKLVANDADVEANGSTEIIVNAHNLDIQMNGAGVIKYVGNPKNINQHINGSGTISKLTS